MIAAANHQIENNKIEI